MSRRDHPRGCGEQRVSPPGLPWRHGTIPVGTGSRSGQPADRRSSGGHPRGCGEQPDVPKRAIKAPGPSLRVRVREADDEWTEREMRRGTIPAGAGNRRPLRPFWPPGRGHPRRVRGARLRPAARRGERGTIPAGAGGGPRPVRRGDWWRASPRWMRKARGPRRRHHVFTDTAAVGPSSRARAAKGVRNSWQGVRTFTWSTAVRSRMPGRVRCLESSRRPGRRGP